MCLQFVGTLFGSRCFQCLQYVGTLFKRLLHPCLQFVKTSKFSQFVMLTMVARACRTSSTGSLRHSYFLEQSDMQVESTMHRSSSEHTKWFTRNIYYVYIRTTGIQVRSAELLVPRSKTIDTCTWCQHLASVRISSWINQPLTKRMSELCKLTI